MMIIKHELRSSLKSFLIWVCCIAGIDFGMILFYPSLQESMKDLAESYEKMGAFGVAFGMDKMSLGNPMGYYGMYVGVMLALCGAMYAAILGTGILAKEEGGHTVEYLFTLPYSRIYIVIQKVLSVLILIFAFELVNVVFGILGLELIGAEYSMKAILLFHVAQFFLHLEVAGIGILISSVTRKPVIGIGLGLALLLYFMDMMSRVLDQLKFCKYITPFFYSNAAEVFVNDQIEPGLLGIGIAVTICCILAAGILYNRRDLSA